MALLRLDRFLCECGAGSRSEVKNFIRKGLVAVDGAVISKPEFKVDTAETEVSLKGQKMAYEKFVYYMLHKPAGVVSATTDSNDPTVTGLLKAEGRDGLFPVGRLDKDTEGLLFLTNDGEWCHNLLSPKKHVPKTYYAKVEGCVTRQMEELFREGIDIGDEKKTLPARLTILHSGEYSEVGLTLHEGRYHQVKRMFEAFHMHVVYLKRTAIGNIALPDGLLKGEYRRMTQEEVLSLTERENGENDFIPGD